MTDVLYPAEDRACGATSGVSRGTCPQLVRDRVRDRADSAGDPAESPGATPKPVAQAPGIKERAAEIELMRGVAAHERAAEIELVRRVIGLVRTRARVLTRNHADADDAMQTAIVEILRSAKSFRGDGSLAGWCERITIRTTLRLQRKQARHVAAIDEAVNPDEVSTTAAELELSDALPGGEVENYLLELSDDRHKALVLRHVLGHSVDEIAEQTGVSPNTVKDRLRMARKQVRQSIRQRQVIHAIKGALP